MPSARATQPAVPLLLGYDTYSIRAWGWKANQHLDFAAKHKLDAIQISSINDFESLEPAHLTSIGDRARQLNLQLDGGTGCICPTTRAWGKRTDDPAAYLAQAIDVAKTIGARCVRVFCGSVADRQGPLPMDAHIESTLKVLKQVRSRAIDANLKIAIENHGDFQARELLTLIDQAGRDFAASCLDTGNPLHIVEHPATTFEILGPVAVTTHYRDSAVCEHPRGVSVQWTALGDGSIDYKAIAALHAGLCPAAPLHLEIITGRPPIIFPTNEPAFWKAFPNARAADFARFLALAKQGRPFSGSMIIADVPGTKPPEYAAALKLQQMRDLERSLDYAKSELGAGRNHRS